MKNALARTNLALRSLIADRKGANMVEYMIIVGVVALLSLGAFTQFGGDVQAKIKAQGTKVGSIAGD
jgi:pilus assembly protein Flp/PilA